MSISYYCTAAAKPYVARPTLIRRTCALLCVSTDIRSLDASVHIKPVQSVRATSAAKCVRQSRRSDPTNHEQSLSVSRELLTVKSLP